MAKLRSDNCSQRCADRNDGDVEVVVTGFDSDTGGEETRANKKGVAWQADDERQAGFKRQDRKDDGEGVIGVQCSGHADKAHAGRVPN